MIDHSLVESRLTAIKDRLIDLCICEDDVSMAWEERSGTRERPVTKTIRHDRVSLYCKRGVMCELTLSDGSVINKSAKTKSFTINGVSASDYIGEKICAMPDDIFHRELPDPTVSTSIGLAFPTELF